MCHVAPTEYFLTDNYWKTMKNQDLYILKKTFLSIVNSVSVELKSGWKKTKFLWTWGIITLFMLPIGISAQVVVPTQISPRLIYQGEDFYTGHGVKEILIEIENTTLSDSDSDYPSCNSGTADIDLSYITNNFSDYWVTLWLPSPQARDGFSTIDLILMIRHATGKDQFDNYDFVAADANNDGTVDTANDVNAWRAVVLNPSLPISWRRPFLFDSKYG